MSGNDNHTYGFSKGDAEELVEMIGGGEGEFVEGRVRPSTKSKGTGEGRFYGFELTSNGFLTTETASADIYELAGPIFGSMASEDADIYDPSKWYAGAGTGRRGICVKQDGLYYAVQSACFTEEE
jgi:hypothetical protein